MGRLPSSPGGRERGHDRVRVDVPPGPRAHAARRADHHQALRRARARAVRDRSGRGRAGPLPRPRPDAGGRRPEPRHQLRGVRDLPEARFGARGEREKKERRVLRVARVGGEFGVRLERGGGERDGDVPAGPGEA